MSSTKARSYLMTQCDEWGSNRRALVLRSLLLADRPLSRNDLAFRTGLGIQSVCGRVSELVRAGILFVVGEKFDIHSDRYVEVLECTNDISTIREITRKQSTKDRLKARINELEAFITDSGLEVPA